MPLMGKKQIEIEYNSYEEISRAFGSPGAECTEIYLCTHSNSSEPSHYEMVSRPDIREALFSSPYIEKAELAWSKAEGTIIPFQPKGEL